MNQNKELLDCKCPSEWLLPSLEIIEEYHGDWKTMWDNLVKMAREKGSKAKEDNIVSALIGSTLTNLELSEGNSKERKLSPDGIQCLNEYRKSGMSGFKKRLALQLINIDESTVNIISYLLEHHSSDSTSISTQKLKEKLFGLGIVNAKKTTPVQGWISLLKFVDLLEPVSSFFIINSQYNAIKKGEKKPLKISFVNALKESKINLRHVTKGSPYIPIPEIRRYVCDTLQISSFTFNEMIMDASNYKGVRLVFATPMRRKIGGITIGKKYYYFIGVFT